MPFLDEQELLSLQEEIHKANVEKEEAEGELEAIEEELTKVKKGSRKTNIFFGILSGLAIALAAYFYTNNSSGTISSSKVAEIKQAEANRVIDSLQSVYSNDNIEQVNPIETDIDNMKASVTNETVYSVQIGAFSNNRYPLLSEIIAGTASQGELVKYSVGLFKTLEEAQKFRKELLKLGFDDAFVASYVNGKRQQIESPN